MFNNPLRIPLELYLETPILLKFPMTVRGVGMDVSWNHTILKQIIRQNEVWHSGDQGKLINTVCHFYFQSSLGLKQVISIKSFAVQFIAIVKIKKH